MKLDQDYNEIVAIIKLKIMPSSVTIIYEKTKNTTLPDLPVQQKAIRIHQS